MNKSIEYNKKQKKEIIDKIIDNYNKDKEVIYQYFNLVDPNEYFTQFQLLFFFPELSDIKEEGNVIKQLKELKNKL